MLTSSGDPTRVAGSPSSSAAAAWSGRARAQARTGCIDCRGAWGTVCQADWGSRALWVLPPMRVLCLLRASSERHLCLARPPALIGLRGDQATLAMPQAGYANLLPELLLALVGHTGEAFLRRQDGSIVLADAVDWCTPPERCGAGEAAGKALLCEPPGPLPAFDHMRRSCRSVWSAVRAPRFSPAAAAAAAAAATVLLYQQPQLTRCCTLLPTRPFTQGAAGPPGCPWGALCCARGVCGGGGSGGGRGCSSSRALQPVPPGAGQRRVGAAGCVPICSAGRRGAPGSRGGGAAAAGGSAVFAGVGGAAARGGGAGGRGGGARTGGRSHHAPAGAARPLGPARAAVVCTAPAVALPPGAVQAAGVLAGARPAAGPRRRVLHPAGGRHQRQHPPPLCSVAVAAASR